MSWANDNPEIKISSDITKIQSPPDIKNDKRKKKNFGLQSSNDFQTHQTFAYGMRQTGQSITSSQRGRGNEVYPNQFQKQERKPIIPGASLQSGNVPKQLDSLTTLSKPQNQFEPQIVEYRETSKQKFREVSQNICSLEVKKNSRDDIVIKKKPKLEVIEVDSDENEHSKPPTPTLPSQLPPPPPPPQTRSSQQNNNINKNNNNHINNNNNNNKEINR